MKGVIQGVYGPDRLSTVLILTLLLAAWAVTRAVEEGSLRWLLVCAFLVGVAFNIKMLQIFLVLPAFGLLYFLAAPLPWRTRLWQAVCGVGATLLVSLPWVLAVELTLPGARPYVGGSTTNSVVELVFGYNGVVRLWGQDWSFFIGAPGPLRLSSAQLAGQIGWLLPLALAGLAVAIWQLRGKEPAVQMVRRRHALILWTGWLFPQMLYFSGGLFYHRYYLATMVPAVAALVGIGADAFWSVWRSGGWRREGKPFLDRDLVGFLERQRADAPYMAATYDLGIAELGILETGAPFMVLGGYRGSDPILTVDRFARLVSDGEVRFCLNLSEPGETWSQQDDIRAWVAAHCPSAAIQPEGIEVLGPCTTVEQ